MSNNKGRGPSILDWFNINDPKHVAAYQYLQDRGLWPKDFLPEPMYFPAGWHTILILKLVDQLLTQRKGMQAVLTQVEEVFNTSVDTPDKHTSNVSVTRYTALTLIGRIRALLDPFRQGGPR